MAGKFLKAGFPAMILRWASGLRFPTLLLVTVILFAVDMVIPDAIPLADELLLGLLALLFANWRKKPPEREGQEPDVPEGE